MTKHSDKKMIGKGIKFLAIALPLLFLSPYLLTMAFLNKEVTAFYIFLILGIIAGGFAIWAIFKALTTFMKAIF
ncbi:N-acetylmuramic acid-6-phosphate etherase [unidentified eubacterium SCB49]|nr:N-acetylmuramic acid-6-phosphate etherase [unidentified eubacterium SCB49]